MSALLCEECCRPVARGEAVIRTTLGRDGLVPLAWCRECRPVGSVPGQRRPSVSEVVQ